MPKDRKHCRSMRGESLHPHSDRSAALHGMKDKNHLRSFCVSTDVDTTHQHFTHNQHIAHTSTAVFSTSVVVPVPLVSQCLCSLLVFWTHSVAQTACLSVAHEKERFHNRSESSINTQAVTSDTNSSSRSTGGS